MKSKPLPIPSRGERPLALETWIREQLPRLGMPAQEFALRPLSGDAGFRRYYRVSLPQPPLLAVDAPPEVEDTGRFVQVAQHLRQLGVCTPRVLAADPVRGFLLLEDFGDRLLHGELSDDTAPLLYGEALMNLLTLQQSPRPDWLEEYGREALARELALFQQWFVSGLLGCTLDDHEQAQLRQLFRSLEDSALEQPQVLVHRDYHSRNLLLTESGTLGVIDFQGALWGPATYDPVSLLRDCYIRWAPEQVRIWALGYGNLAREVGLLPEAVSEERFLRWFDWMGLQRHIKVLGIFARLSLRDGKHDYLADLPLVIRYTLEVAEQYPELAAFANWFRQRLLPLAQQQPWYRDYRNAGDRQ